MVAARVEQVSCGFLGCPYRINPLKGSAETPEVFVASTGAFDCVTYVETVLARAFGRNSRDFREYLRRLRYRAGQVSWISRNHYMINWIRNNTREGFVRPVSLSSAEVLKERMLDMLPGLPAQRQRFKCLPKRLLPTAAKKIQSGDLIFFASTRPHLDVFHCGIVVWKGGGLLLRHASRSRGGVVEQELSDFLKENRMAGVIIVRPLEQ